MSDDIRVFVSAHHATTEIIRVYYSIRWSLRPKPKLLHTLTLNMHGSLKALFADWPFLEKGSKVIEDMEKTLHETQEVA